MQTVKHLSVVVLCPTDYSETQSVEVWLLQRLAAVEQHVSAGGLHRLVLHLSDRCVIKVVPGPGDGTVAHSRVVPHVQVTRVILEKAKTRRSFSANRCAVV